MLYNYILATAYHVHLPSTVNTVTVQLCMHNVCLHVMYLHPIHCPTYFTCIVAIAAMGRGQPPPPTLTQGPSSLHQSLPPPPTSAVQAQGM